MIRINLLPRSLRRRRPGLRREAVVGATMLLGWFLVMSVGSLWIAAQRGKVSQLRAQREAVEEATRRTENQRQHVALATRQKVLGARREALALLRGERYTPAARLQELAALFTASRPDSFAGGAADEAPDRTGSPAPFGLVSPAPLRLLEVRSRADAGAPAAWRVVGTARDAAALGGLVRRLRASERVRLLAGPEFVREGEDRLRFDVDLALTAWD